MYIKLFFLYLPTNSHTGFLPCCWPTHTYPPLLFERKPPDYPSAGPSVQLGQEWGRWPAHCSDTHTHTNRKNVHLQLRLHRLLEITCLFISLPLFCWNVCRTRQTHSLWTRWLRRSCVMSSCQDFLMPPAEGEVAVGKEPRLPTPSFIRLREMTDELVKVSASATRLKK